MGDVTMRGDVAATIIDGEVHVSLPDLLIVLSRLELEHHANDRLDHAEAIGRVYAGLEQYGQVVELRAACR